MGIRRFETGSDPMGPYCLAFAFQDTLITQIRPRIPCAYSRAYLDHKEGWCLAQQFATIATEDWKAIEDDGLEFTRRRKCPVDSIQSWKSSSDARLCPSSEFSINEASRKSKPEPRGRCKRSYQLRENKCSLDSSLLYSIKAVRTCILGALDVGSAPELSDCRRAVAFIQLRRAQALTLRVIAMNVEHCTASYIPSSSIVTVSWVTRETS